MWHKTAQRKPCRVLKSHSEMKGIRLRSRSNTAGRVCVCMLANNQKENTPARSVGYNTSRADVKGAKLLVTRASPFCIVQSN